MKAIFLDIDGVLNYIGTEARSPSGFRGIVDKLVDNLAYVVDKTGAILVLASSWRHDLANNTLEPMTPEAKYLVNKLKRHGLHLSSKTEEDVKSRPHAIVDWIQKHTMEGELTRWVVVDDDVCLYDEANVFAPADFIDHVVFTSESSGLTKEKAEEVIRVLTD